MTAIRIIFDGKTFVPDQPVSLPANSEGWVLVDSADPEAQCWLDEAVRAYYRGETEEEDEQWGKGVERDLRRAWDEDWAK